MSEDMNRSVDIPVRDTEKSINDKNDKLHLRRKSSSITRFFRTLGIMALLVPTCALIGPSLIRQIDALNYQIKSLEETSYGGEYDPAGGEEITSENGRALVVVHQGHGEEVYPQKYESDDAYQDYLRRVDALKNIYVENGDPVVIVVTDYAIAKGYELIPSENVLYLVTNSNNGIAMASFRQDKYNYSQDQQNVWDILEEAGVRDIEIAGEFRGACPYQIGKYAEGSGLNVWWSADAAYPIADEPEDFATYPTIEPLFP